ncbi:shikimate kinase [Streptomyces sp. PR69]|uniref:shikimate kinase n=1 Tax=Streptomyces sp. PR69 TaxID=2984950 RepID=UPI002264544A|nr:shikimate kinase [Streptomyces sp. PR69]
MTFPLAVLIGPPGVGRTSVAKILAARTGTTARDTDQDVVRLTGCSVSQIFAERGEPYFRSLEHEAIRAALREHSGVLALGGGAVVHPRHDPGRPGPLRRGRGPGQGGLRHRVARGDRRRRRAHLRAWLPRGALAAARGAGRGC